MFAIPFPSSQSPTIAPNLDTVKETPNSVWWPNYAGPSSYNPHTMEKKYRISGIEGQQLLPKISYSCTASADPIHQPTIQIGALAADGSTVGFAGLIAVELTYWCTFWQKKIFYN
jgi:hypothetical protein